MENEHLGGTVVTKQCGCPSFQLTRYWLVDRERGTLSRHLECAYCHHSYDNADISSSQLKRERRVLAEGSIYSPLLPDGLHKEYLKRLDYGFLKRYLKK